MQKSYLSELKDFYFRELTENVLPFWLAHARDREAGGYHTCLDRDGTVYDYDKVCMWHAGRMIWTYSHMYNELDGDEAKKTEYLEMASWGVDFTEKYGFMPDGSMYYGLTREGKPLEAKQDVYTELSTVLGYTEYARAIGEEKWYDKAKEIFLAVWETFQEPGRSFQGLHPEGRPARLHGHSMITLNVIQELRRFREEPQWEEKIDECLSIMIGKHLKEEKKAIFELVGWDGKELPGYRGRWVNPGHMIEGGTFLIHEGQRRKDPRLRETGVNIIDWGFQWGWDKEFGGIYNDVDSEGLPIPAGHTCQAATKLWWQHAEALYALLLAYAETEEYRFLKAYQAVHDYSFSCFADPVYGEWYASLDRRGKRINDAKGTARKSPFHIGRNFYNAYKLLKGLAGE